jgi:hypothetical protein
MAKTCFPVNKIKLSQMCNSDYHQLNNLATWLTENNRDLRIYIEIAWAR